MEGILYEIAGRGGEEGDEGKGEKGRGRGGQEEISREEVRRVVREMKDGKDMGVDGIPNEVWKYGGAGMEEWIWGFCNKVWRGGGWPEKWKEGIISPIVKKGEGEKVEDYRGVTLMTSAYKIYAAVLAGRIREEVEEKGILTANQTGFRKGMGTVDSIFTLNYLINRQLIKKGGKLVALFVDFKAAFDSVDRGVLVETMRERGVREGLVRRVEELLRETKCRVKGRRGGGGEQFWTARGVRQGCPLSPLLFNILMADLEEKMGKVSWGELGWEGEKVYSLLYADDTVLLAKYEGGMKSMVERMEGYVDRKGLEINVGETKIMRFRRGGEDSKDGVEMEGRKVGRGERVHIPRIHIAKEWRAGSAREGEGKESSGNNGAGMGTGEKKIW